ncbi:Panacea domain-containing protein [Moraxella sp. ZJ142]|uniref:Panacea domain-containing protein n=1 Tax=Moraxella marmotae TaxID=3344520 RepID=UPI0035D456C3
MPKVYQAMDVANYIVVKAAERHNPVTSLTLQKLLYYVVAKYVKLFNAKLIDEDIVKWQYGPVVKSVYGYFKIYWEPISEPVAYLTSRGIGNIRFADVDDIVFQMRQDAKLTKVVKQVLDELGSFSNNELSKRTQQEAAWADNEFLILYGPEQSYSISELRAANI